MPIVHVMLIEGRSPQSKAALIKGLTDAVVQAINAAPETVRVILQDVPASHWGVGGVAKRPIVTEKPIEG
jgi:4-oxalocrotonate tautomerase